MLESPLYVIKNHEMQYCAKVMRANFDEIRALFSQFFVELSPDISNELSQRSCESSTIFRRNFENTFEMQHAFASNIWDSRRRFVDGGAVIR